MLLVSLLLVVEIQTRVISVAVSGHFHDFGVFIRIKKIINRTASRNRPVTPHIVHLRQRCLSIAFRHTHGRTILVCMGISGIDSETKILACIHIQLKPSGYSVVSTSNNDTFLIKVIDGSCILDGLGTTCNRNRMIIYRC